VTTKVLFYTSILHIFLRDDSLSLIYVKFLSVYKVTRPQDTVFFSSYILQYSILYYSLNV